MRPKILPSAGGETGIDGLSGTVNELSKMAEDSGPPDVDLATGSEQHDYEDS